MGSCVETPYLRKKQQQRQEQQQRRQQQQQESSAAKSLITELIARHAEAGAVDRLRASGSKSCSKLVLATATSGHTYHVQVEVAEECSGRIGTPHRLSIFAHMQSIGQKKLKTNTYVVVS